MNERVTLRLPDDFHVHLRDGAMLRLVAPHTAAHFGRALVMPNVPAIHTGKEADLYRDRILSATGSLVGFDPMLSIKLTHETTPTIIREAAHYDILSAKIYPSGVTTGSHDGIRDIDSLWPVFRVMQDFGMVLCVHGELPGAFVLDRERDYLPTVARIVKHFPGLKIVLEHVTTRAAVEFVEAASVNVAATITAHHLKATLDDVIGDGIRPHNFCYPVPKTPDDRSALHNAALSRNSRYMFGSDSAPHRQGDKESACGCAGCYTAPVALPTLAEVFLGTPEAEDGYWYRVWKGGLENNRDALERFTSRHGAEFYGLPPNEGTITLERSPWTVPASCALDDGTALVPWRAGETLAWRVVEGEEEGRSP